MRLGFIGGWGRRRLIFRGGAGRKTRELLRTVQLVRSHPALRVGTASERARPELIARLRASGLAVKQLMILAPLGVNKPR